MLLACSQSAMMTARKMRKPVAGMTLIVFGYCIIKFMNLKKELTDGAYYNSIDGRLLKLPDEMVVDTPARNEMAQCEKVIRVAAIVLEASSCRDFELLLKTVLYHRSHGLHLYVVSTHVTKRISQRLLETWDLPHVAWSLVDVEELKVVLPASNKQTFLLSWLPRLLPQHVTKVIYFSNRMRLLDDVYHLWRHFDHFSEPQTLGTLAGTSTVNQNSMTSPDILMLNTAKIRKKYPHASNNSRMSFGASAVTLDTHKALFENAPYILPCSWGVRPGPSAKECHFNDSINAFVWDPREDAFTTNEIIESAKEKIASILRSDSALYHSPALHCSGTPAKNKMAIDPKDSCIEYRYAAETKRRTHLYYVAPSSVFVWKEMGPNDVTLLTQFTLDRFTTFERFMENWEGPVSAVIYATDADAVELPERIASSGVLQKRLNIAYHVVYKRGKFYPINYLRNVALREAHTPYLFFVDVDLVVNYDLYRMLKQYITKYMLHRSNVTLVVPAFESLVPLDTLPRNKSQLLDLIEEKKVIGYRMNRGWNLGHRPTDYPKWIKATEPYQVIWKDAYEPYVILPTKQAPLYREVLLERMGDKIAYGREIYARGYEFWVLPDVFLVHLPHPTSTGTNAWKTYRGYARCGAKLFDEYRSLLKKQYQNKRF